MGHRALLENSPGYPDRTLDPARISTNVSQRSVPEQNRTSSASWLNSRKKRSLRHSDHQQSKMNASHHDSRSSKTWASRTKDPVPREQINFQSRLTADVLWVLWGSFVTHSNDVCGEATFSANKPKQPVRKKQNADNKDFELIIIIKTVGYENKWNYY